MPKFSSSVVGIDLGTTFSALAYVDSKGRPTTVANLEGELLTPSVVYFHDESTVVGREAIKAAAFEPDRVARHAKRDMGKPRYARPVAGTYLPPEVILALVLKKLKQDAELKIGPIEQAVITVPAYYNEPRRKATQDAGRLAGLEVLDIINEPTAAAIAYGIESGFLDSDGTARQTENVLVYDLGGGTFDATLMRIQGRSFQALATAGDVHLGGIDWDQRIVDHIAELFQREHGVDPRADDHGYQDLLREAIDAKHALTSRPYAPVHVVYNGHRWRGQLSRDELERMSEDLLQRTLFTTGAVLKEANCEWDDVTQVLLVGGASRMPMVHQSLAQRSGKSPNRSLSPDESVAQGAALYAQLLAQADSNSPLDFEIINVNSHDLGVLGIDPQTGRPRRKLMVPRNTPLPATQSAAFVTAEHGQRSVAIQIIEGGDASGHQATPIGKCVIRDLPANLPKQSRVTVTFEYESNGRLTVNARVPSVGQDACLTLNRASGLSEDELLQWSERLASGQLFENAAAGSAQVQPSPDAPSDLGESPENVLDGLDSVRDSHIDWEGDWDPTADDSSTAGDSPTAGKLPTEEGEATEDRGKPTRRSSATETNRSNEAVDEPTSAEDPLNALTAAADAPTFLPRVSDGSPAESDDSDDPDDEGPDEALTDFLNRFQ